MKQAAMVFSREYLLHDTKTHPESKKRIEEIEKVAKEMNLWDKFAIIEPKKIELEKLKKVHCSDYISRLESFSATGGGRWDPDTVVCDKTYEIALLACGGALQAVDEVVSGNRNKSFAIVRPPGHHAEPDRGMGYCLFNNTAVAARTVKNEENINKIAIIDIDAHHGNGIEKIFYDDPGVLYISIHQSPLFPGTGYAKSSGNGQGEGYNVNIPIPKETGYSGYDFAFKQIVDPILFQYQPELIIVATGLDAYFMDPLTNLFLNCKGFEMIIDNILASADQLCEGKVACVLEGGYSIPGVGKPTASILSRLVDERLGEEFYSEQCTDSFSSEAQSRLDEVIKWQKRYWKL